MQNGDKCFMRRFKCIFNDHPLVILLGKCGSQLLLFYFVIYFAICYNCCILKYLELHLIMFVLVIYTHLNQSQLKNRTYEKSKLDSFEVVLISVVPYSYA